MPLPEQAPTPESRRAQKSFFGVKVLHDVSFEAHGGRVLGIVGENGSGKSTTMNLLTGVLPRDGGAVLLDGENFESSFAARVGCGRHRLHPAGAEHLSESLRRREPVPVPAPASRRLAAVRVPQSHRCTRPRAPEDGRSRRRARTLAGGTLSAGERQLLEIARGLAFDARVLILDEPTSSLTGRETARLFEIIGRLQAARCRDPLHQPQPRRRAAACR